MTITRKILLLKNQRLILPKKYRLNQDLIEKSVLPLMSCKTITNVHSENEVLDGYIADIDTEDDIYIYVNVLKELKNGTCVTM